MTTTELTKEVQTCCDIDPEHASEIVIRALRFKAETPHQQRCLAAAEETNSSSHQFVERAYTSRLVKVKVVELELSLQQCLRYLDFTRRELKAIFSDDEIWSETFYLGDLELALIGRCSLGKSSVEPYFWLDIDAWGSSSSTLYYDLTFRSYHHLKFRRFREGSITFTEPESLTYLCNVPWTDFVEEYNTYFINDILHVRLKLTIDN